QAQKKAPRKGLISFDCVFYYLLLKELGVLDVPLPVASLLLPLGDFCCISDSGSPECSLVLKSCTLFDLFHSAVAFVSNNPHFLEEPTAAISTLTTLINALLTFLIS